LRAARAFAPFFGLPVRGCDIAARNESFAAACIA
jgi:hypothetical protein